MAYVPWATDLSVVFVELVQVLECVLYSLLAVHGDAGPAAPSKNLDHVSAAGAGGRS